MNWFSVSLVDSTRGFLFPSRFPFLSPLLIAYSFELPVPRESKEYIRNTFVPRRLRDVDSLKFATTLRSQNMSCHRFAISGTTCRLSPHLYTTSAALIRLAPDGLRLKGKGAAESIFPEILFRWPRGSERRETSEEFFLCLEFSQAMFPSTQIGRSNSTTNGGKKLLLLQPCNSRRRDRGKASSSHVCCPLVSIWARALNTAGHRRSRRLAPRSRRVLVVIRCV